MTNEYNPGAEIEKLLEQGSTFKSPNRIGVKKKTQIHVKITSEAQREESRKPKKKKTVELIPITNLTEIPPEWREEFLEKFETHQKEISKFILIDLIALESAFSAAVEDSLECLKILADADHPGLEVGKVRASLNKMIDAKLVLFLSNRLGLSTETISPLMQDLLSSDMQKLMSMYRGKYENRRPMESEQPLIRSGKKQLPIVNKNRR